MYFLILTFHLFCLLLEFYEELSKEIPSLKEKDATNYKPLILPALTSNFMNYTIITSNEGTGGPILLDVLNMINNTYNKDISKDLLVLNTFKGKTFIKNFKFI